MKVLDLFSGIGGFSIGLERAGMKTIAFCEEDEYCKRVLAKNWVGVPIYEDVRELTAGTLSQDGIDAEVICGGFPCQDISRAGNRAGIRGERSGLWCEFARLIGELRPKFAIVENVAALLDNGMGTVLGDLAALGYDAEWSVVSACSMGAPHMRQRVFVVAYPNSIYGRARLWDSTAHEHRKIQEIYNLEGARARVRSRLEDPSALYGGADGVPDRMERNKAHGNSVYWPITEMIGRAIMKVEMR